MNSLNVKDNTELLKLIKTYADEGDRDHRNYEKLMKKIDIYIVKEPNVILDMINLLKKYQLYDLIYRIFLLSIKYKCSIVAKKIVEIKNDEINDLFDFRIFEKHADSMNFFISSDIISSNYVNNLNQNFLMIAIENNYYDKIDKTKLLDEIDINHLDFRGRNLLYYYIDHSMDITELINKNID